MFAALATTTATTILSIRRRVSCHSLSWLRHSLMLDLVPFALPYTSTTLPYILTT